MQSGKNKKPTAPSPAPAKGDATSPFGDYEPTQREKAAFENYKERGRKQSPAPRVKVGQQNGAAQVSVDHANQGLGYLLLAEAFATTDYDFLIGLLNQLSNAAQRGGKVGETELNFLVSVIKDIKPRDQFESMLAAQMAVTHEAMMTFARRLGNVENIQQQDSAVNAYTKLARTYAAQLEAFKRYRTGGEQKVTVQHVNVSEGGQAIVGNVTTQPARRPAPEQASTDAPALAHSKEAPMPMVSEREAAPVAIHQKRKHGRRSPA